MDIAQSLSGAGFSFKERGVELYLSYCPRCENPEDGDYSHLSFRADNGLFRCKKCDYKGNYWQFAADMGLTIEKAKQTPKIKPVENPEFFNNADNFYRDYGAIRGILPETFKAFRVGRKISTDGKIYVVYHFYNTQGELINRKYRNIGDKKDCFCEKGADTGYYGAQLLDPKNRVLYITEGEDDAHALWQLGFRNVLSVPNGAQSAYTPSMDAINQKAQTIYLLYDNDPDGRAGARKMAEKAGFEKCIDVFLPFKDVRDCLLQGMGAEEIEQYIRAGKKYEIKEIIKADGYNLFQEQCSLSTKNKRFNSFMGGIRPAELTIITGHTGSGKTTSALNMIYWAAQTGIGSLVMSFENKFRSTLLKLIQISSGEILFENKEDGNIRLCKSREWIVQQQEKLANMPIWFLSQQSENGYFDIDAIQSFCVYAKKFFNVQIILIDNLHYILKIKHFENATLEIDESIRKIGHIARKNELHIFLIAHPYKSENKDTGKPARLGIYCVKGSATVAQEADNFMVIERAEEESKSKWILKKSREWKLGEITYNVWPNNNKIGDINGFEN